MQLLHLLLIGLIAGWLTGLILKQPGRSWVQTLIVGVVGALLGGVLFRVLGLFPVGLLGEIVSATVGGLVFLWLLRYLPR